MARWTLREARPASIELPKQCHCAGRSGRRGSVRTGCPAPLGLHGKCLLVHRLPRSARCSSASRSPRRQTRPPSAHWLIRCEIMWCCTELPTTRLEFWRSSADASALHGARLGSRERRVRRCSLAVCEEVAILLHWRRGFTCCRRPERERWCTRPDSNRYDFRRGIFLPLRLSPPKSSLFVVWTLPWPELCAVGPPPSSLCTFPHLMRASLSVASRLQGFR